MQSNYDYSEFAPQNADEDQYDYSEFSPKKKKSDSGSFESMDLFNPIDRFKLLVSGVASDPVQNAAAINEGVRRIGQGLKQVGLQASEKLGFDTEPEKYTQQVQESRRQFAKTPAGRSPYSQMITEGTQMAPLAALPGGMQGSMLKKMLVGGTGFGAYEGLKFTPEDESRLGHIVKGFTIGASIPPGLKVAGKIADKALYAAESLARGKPSEIINKIDPNLAQKRKFVQSQIADIEEKLPEASEKLAKIEPEVIEAQTAHEEAKQGLTEAQEAAEENPYVGKSKRTAIQRDLNNADIDLQNLNKARQETEQAISETTVPEPFQHDAKIVELEKSAAEKQAAADKYAAEMKAKDEEFKAAQEKAQENPYVRATTKGAVQGKINVNIRDKAQYEREQALTRKEHAANLEAEHKAEQEASKATYDRLQAEANMSKAESHVKTAENEVKATDHNISQFLDKRKEHDVDVAKGVFEIADAERAAISDEFKAVEADIAETNIHLPNETALRAKNEEILKSIQENKLHTHTKEMMKLLDELESIKNAKTTIPASEYLRMYNTLRQESAKARSKAFQTGINDEERFAAQERYNALDEKIEEMADVLKKGIGKENAERLQKARDAWRDNVAVLYKNPVYQTIKWQGRINGDIMKTLRGTDKGNVKIRNIILNNPQLSKDTLGQRFAHKPENVSDIGVQEEQYINAVPEFKNMVEQRNAATQLSESSQARYQNAKEAHDIAKIREKEVHDAHKAAKTLKGQTQKALDDLTQKLDKIEKEQPELIKHRDELVKIAKDKKTTLPKKLQAEAEVKEINAHLEKVKAEKVGHEKVIKSKQDEIAAHTTNLEKINNKIAAIEEKLPHQKAALKDITEKAASTKITYKEKVKLEKEKADLTKIVKTGDGDVKRLKKQQQDLNEKIDKSRTGLYKYVKTAAKQVPRVWRFTKKLFKGV